MLTIGRNIKYITGELQGLLSEYSDPLFLGFKVMIDYTKPYGLFAPESNVDSALAFLKRIGEVSRANLLESFIDNLQKICKNHEYLFQTIEGLSEIASKNQNEQFFMEDNKLNITFRETIDMKIQSLVNAYRNIWFDDMRGVEVLPQNLREFDMYIVIYSNGYFQEGLYGYDESNDESKGNILPTIKKVVENLTLEKMNDISNIQFNCSVFYIGAASINVQESGKGFYESVSNTANPEEVRNSIAFNYKFARLNGIFNNIFGDVDFSRMFALLATTNKSEKQKFKPLTSKADVKNYVKSVGDAFTNAAKDIKDDITNKRLDDLKNRGARALKRLTAEETFVGNALKNFSDSKYLSGMVTNTLDKATNYLEDRFVNRTMSKLNNLVSMNFADNLYDVFKNFTQSPREGVNMLPNEANIGAGTSGANMIEAQAIKTPAQPRHYAPEKIHEVEKGITFKTGNIYSDIYKRDSF
jgi:hypothetical protein